MTVCIDPRVRPSERPSAPTSGSTRGAFRLGHVRARPAPPLARYVDHYWVTRWDGRGHTPPMPTALLDPCVHLHVRDGQAEIMGVVRGMYRTRIEGVGCVIGVRFRPGGFYPFVRQRVALWNDGTVPAEEALGTAGGPTAT